MPEADHASTLMDSLRETPEARLYSLTTHSRNFVRCYQGFTLLSLCLAHQSNTLPAGVRIPGLPNFQFPIWVDDGNGGEQVPCVIETQRLPVEHQVALFQIAAEAKRVEAMEALRRFLEDGAALRAILEER